MGWRGEGGRRERVVFVVVVLSCVDKRACLCHARCSSAPNLNRVYQCSPSSVRLTDRQPYACASGNRFQGVQAAKSLPGHSNSRKITAFLTTSRRSRKVQPFPSLGRRASLPHPHFVNRSLAIKTPAHDTRCIIHSARERKITPLNQMTVIISWFFIHYTRERMTNLKKMIRQI